MILCLGVLIGMLVTASTSIAAPEWAHRMSVKAGEWVCREWLGED